MIKYYKELENPDSQVLHLLHDGKPIDVTLPNSWYITSYGRLYNCLSFTGHAVVSLSNTFMAVKNADFSDSFTKYSIKDIVEEENLGYITYMSYDSWLHWKYDFPYVPLIHDIEPSYIVSKNDIPLTKILLDTPNIRCYNPLLNKIVIGASCANMEVYESFIKLKESSLDYMKEVTKLLNYSKDEILIRFCGFHKISSIMPKTIVTSAVNYDELFNEYIEKGWNIDFVSPFIINEDNKEITEYSQDFLTIKKVLKK